MMTQKKVAWIGEVFFWLAVILAYFKTAELLSSFSPREIFGFTGIETWYGMACALLVEGVFVYAKYTIQRSRIENERTWSFIMAVGAGLISFVAQGLDTYMVKGNLDKLPVEVVGALQVIVPAIPAIVMIVFAISGAMASSGNASRSEYQSRPSVMAQSFGREVPSARLGVTGSGIPEMRHVEYDEAIPSRGAEDDHSPLQ